MTGSPTSPKRPTQPGVPARDRPEQRSQVRRGRGRDAARSSACAAGSCVQAHGHPAVAPRLVRAVGGVAECRFPISFHSAGFKAARAPDTPEMEKEYAIQYRLVRFGAVPDRHHGGPGVAACLRRLREIPDFNFVLGESGVTWLPYIFDRLDTEYHDRARSLGFKLKPSLTTSAARAMSPTSRTPSWNRSCR